MSVLPGQEFDIAAYYWPAYHDEPRWRLFMPEGEGEWQTIRKAKPRFEGHYQPRVPIWGYQDESDPRVMEQKIDAAAAHGVNVFIFDWYWYDNQPFLEEALNRGFLGARNNDKIRFFLMWANHCASSVWDLERSDKHVEIWPGTVDRPTFDYLTDRIIERYFHHPSYYRIDGKPVFSIYDTGGLIRGLGGLTKTRDALDSFRARARVAGFPDLHLQAILWSIPATRSDAPGDNSENRSNTVRALDYDSLTNYQWAIYTSAETYGEWAEKATAPWDHWAVEFPAAYIPHVSIGWDTNPRYKRFTGAIKECAPSGFANYLQKAMDLIERHNISPKLITVNSWNEWSEGSYLEPDTLHGMGYLEAVRDTLKKAQKNKREIG